MKKFLLFLTLIYISSIIYAEKLPANLLGLWEGKDRYVFFENNEDEEAQLVIILKSYYGWYLDRAAEPESYAEKEERTRNIATPRKAEQVEIKNLLLGEEAEAYGSMDLYFSRWQKNIVPFCILGDSLYLKYFVLDEREEEATTEGSLDTSEKQESQYKFYRGIAPSKGFMLSMQSIPENITGLIIDGEKLYDVRYWLTDMDYSTDYVSFIKDEDSYTIPKHLRSCETNYSAVSGRSKKVRNTVGPFEYNKDDYIFSSDEKFFTPKEEPYLKRLADKNTFEDLMALVKEANSRRKPDPPALFPDSNLDWHWDLIDMLEKDNKLIQAVRERQRAFGPRAKDLENN